MGLWMYGVLVVAIGLLFSVLCARRSLLSRFMSSNSRNCHGISTAVSDYHDIGYSRSVSTLCVAEYRGSELHEDEALDNNHYLDCGMFASFSIF